MARCQRRGVAGARRQQLVQQLGGWWRLPQLSLGWYLPLAGALCGYVTNALALGVIFNPIEPIEACGLRLHGLFLQRQAEVSLEFATIVASRIVTAASSSHLASANTLGPPRSGGVGATELRPRAQAWRAEVPCPTCHVSDPQRRSSCRMW